MSTAPNFRAEGLVEESHALLDHGRVPTTLQVGDVLLWYPECSEFHAELRIARGGTCLRFIAPDGIERWGARSYPHSLEEAPGLLQTWVSTDYVHEGLAIEIEDVSLLADAQEVVRGVIVKR